MARQCTQPKRPKNSEWFKEKMLLAQALEAWTDDLDSFDSDCDEAQSASGVVIAKLSAYDSDVLSEVPTYDTYQDNNVINQIVQEMQNSEQPVFVDGLDIDITSDNNVISYDQYLKEKKVKLKGFEIKKKELLIENDHLLKQLIFQDIMCTVMHADVENKYVLPVNDETLVYVNMYKSYIDEYSRCLKLEAELSKKKDLVEKDVYNEISNRFSRLEKEQDRALKPLDNVLDYACARAKSVKSNKKKE
ncbi:hypothetical protein Tco_0732865 [Tanacetum coccineum]